jgi:hypothetical protein
MHDPPDVHDTHDPEALQTWLVPQIVPVPSCVTFAHVWVPVAHE